LINIVGHVASKEFIPFIDVINYDKGSIYDYFTIKLQNRTYPFPSEKGPFTENLLRDFTLYESILSENALETADLFFSNQNNNTSVNENLSLIGDPLRFPFDRYYLNLTFAIPFKNANIEYDIMEILPKNNWNTTTTVATQVSKPNASFFRFFPNSFNTESYSPDDINFLQFKIDFKRNYTISTIIIPLVAIYYLLGAIFIFKSSDSMSNILALTLGIFALIFTLPEIINSMKPQTTSPTIADSMLSTIILSTIAFTVSSIISSSPIIQKWFPRHYSWIDGLVFAIVAGFVILYFKFLFDTTIWWLVPVIVFGLGYGLLLRLLGFKIDRPIIEIIRGSRTINKNRTDIKEK
jgi:hypothetical protein